MSITTANGLKAVNIFKDPKQKMSQDKFYFLMDGMISRGLFEKSRMICGYKKTTSFETAYC